MRGKESKIATYKIWDTPTITKQTLLTIVDKHPNKPLVVIVWKPKEVLENV